MLIIFALATLTTLHTGAAAVMTGRVLGSVRATSREWHQAGTTLHQREITVQEADGRKTRVRMTEFE